MVITFNSTNADAIFGATPGSAVGARTLAAAHVGLSGPRTLTVVGGSPRRRRVAASGTRACPPLSRHNDEPLRAGPRRAR